MEGAAIVPGILFLAGIVAIFISGGSMTFLVAGDAAVFLAGIAFIFKRNTLQLAAVGIKGMSIQLGFGSA